MTLIDLYVKRISEGHMKLKDVPPRWYEEVKQLLAQRDMQSN